MNDIGACLKEDKYAGSVNMWNAHAVYDIWCR